MPDPRQGDIWRYDYLWDWQAARGETEGRKARPVAFVAVVKGQTGTTRLYILALTTKPPAKETPAIEVPVLERRRAGLSDTDKVWVILNEYNQDVLEHSYYFQPDARLGEFGPSFRKKVLTAFGQVLKEGNARAVRR
jgi:hypothetical protein